MNIKSNNRTRMKTIIPSLLIVLLALIFITLYARSQQSNKHITPKHTSNVEANKGNSNYSPTTLILHGRVESYKLTTIESAITADVMKVTVKDGNFVKQGDLLVQLDDRETKIQYKQRKGELDDLKAQIQSEYIRFKSDKNALIHQEKLIEIQKGAVTRLDYLHKKRVSSESVLDKAKIKYNELSIKLADRNMKLNNHKYRLAQLKARLLKAKAFLSQAALNSERTRIKAPFTGRITKVYISVGNRAQKAEKLIEMFAADAVEIRVQIPTAYLASIKKSLEKNVVITAKVFVDNHWLHLRLDRLAGVIAPNKNGIDGVDAIFTILNDGKNLAKGRVIKLKLQLPHLK